MLNARDHGRLTPAICNVLNWVRQFTLGFTENTGYTENLICTALGGPGQFEDRTTYWTKT